MFALSQSNTCPVARGDAAIEVGVARRMAANHCAAHRAQRVAREIADDSCSSARPACSRRQLPRVSRPSIDFIFVPQRRNVVGLDLAFDQRALDLVAQMTCTG
jgi:hypothetical protein